MSPAKVVKFCEGSYDARCDDCDVEICMDQEYPVADRLAVNHNEVHHGALPLNREPSA